MSTRYERERRDLGDGWPTPRRGGWARDPAEEVALVAQAGRRLLLSVHRHLLVWEDLEDCYGQATFELVVQARRGELRYSSRTHLRNMLELRFVSRIRDRRRALRGRSPVQATLDGALSLGEIEIVDVRADVERRAMSRFDLRSLERAAYALSADQRLVLACQVGLQMSTGDFCRRFGWSHAKHRKVAQRARTRLRHLLTEAGAEDEAATPVRHPEKTFRTGVPFSGASRSRGQGPTYDHISPHS